MSLNSENSADKDVDLFYLIKKIGEFFDRLGFSIYKFFRFVIKNSVILLILLGLGIAGGYLLDYLIGDRYRHEIIVVPNFGSTTYLYDKIDGISYEDSSLKLVELEPIVNVYEFIRDRYQNLEMVKYFSENDIVYDKFKKDSRVEQFYRYHLLTFYTKELEDTDKVLNDFLAEINREPYYLDRQKIETLNTSRSIEELKNSIDNINKILDRLGTSEDKTGNVSIENYSELNELVNAKRSLTDELNKMEIFQMEETKVIYDSARIINVKDNKLAFKIILPIVLLFGFFGFVTLRKFSKRYKTY